MREMNVYARESGFGSEVNYNRRKRNAKRAAKRKNLLRKQRHIQ